MGLNLGRSFGRLIHTWIQAQMQVQAYQTVLSEQAGNCRSSLKVPPPWDGGTVESVEGAL